MNRVAIIALSSWFALAGALSAHAQSITTICSFNNLNGANPEAGLTLGPDGNFYGTTEAGGASQKGTVYRVTTNGALTTLVSFSNTNGANPYAGLTLGPDGNFYGTTLNGGSGGNGTVFKVTTNGVLTTLVTFIYTNDSSLRGSVASLTLGQSGIFYGTTEKGGSDDSGAVFSMTPDGTFTVLASFNHETNGAIPSDLMLGPDGNFYGTTYTWGSSDFGTVFKMTTNGVLTTLVNFTNGNGSYPRAGLTLGPDGNSYGTTYQGGSTNMNGGAGYGTVFKMTTNGVLTTLVNFNNNNGANPYASLTLGPDGNFYGTTYGGIGIDGSVFKVTTNGVLTKLVNFTNVNGGHPYAGLTLGRDGNFYGTTATGGSAGYGTIFKLVLPKISSISNSGGSNFTLSLAGVPNSTNRLWATTNFALGPWQVIATNVTDSNGLAQFFDTNTGGMPQKFYRLSNP